MILHCAGLSRPMDIHQKNIEKSINLNIIGTANVVKVCRKKNIKIIYFSTGYVYEGKKGNYSEKSRIGDHICYYSDLSNLKKDFPDWKITKDLDMIFN